MWRPAPPECPSWFVCRHEEALAGLFGEGLCAEAGLVKAQLIAIDGTKVAANASRDADRDYAQIAREILEQAKAVDQVVPEISADLEVPSLMPCCSLVLRGRVAVGAPVSASVSRSPGTPLAGFPSTEPLEAMTKYNEESRPPSTARARLKRWAASAGVTVLEMRP